ncbi:MAG: hypothetical protein K0R98_213 [Rickettsiaceae bacterium]|jgi:hypothetical protein|nr:hypothetical protein [Rickettsiaceae bacterium]
MSVKNITALSFIKIVFKLGLCSVLAACSTTNFSYVSRQNLQSDPLYQNEGHYNPNAIVTEKKPMSLGALKFQSEGMNPDEGKLLLLQRKKGIYMAETMIQGEKKRKYFFSFGIDPKKQASVIGFRMKF